MIKEEMVTTQNNVFQKFIVLKTNRNKRFKYREFIVEGVRNIKEAIQNDWEIESFIFSSELGLSDWAKGVIASGKTSIDYNLSAQLMREISGKEDTSELMAVVKMKADVVSLDELSGNPVLALFDRPSNKGNLGTIIRSCDSLGIELLILTGHAVDLYDPDVITATMGSFFNMKVIRIQENVKVLELIKELKQKYPGFQTIGTTAHKKNPLYQIDMKNPIMFMIGNETDGLCNAFEESCDVLGTIPMAESSFASSFNVGCAATVMFYEASRQRNQK
ncbi:MAG TPA: TrmH family RNA methyltransferase [Lachnospiraceae bacterium]|nr:TrmH family RNA methyltransferase [Lachnospiraceae bacterium]